MSHVATTKAESFIYKAMKKPPKKVQLCTTNLLLPNFFVLVHAEFIAS
jgi:hypothetical protein